MLMNDGVDPVTNETIIPIDVLERIERGVTTPDGKAAYPELVKCSPGNFVPVSNTTPFLVCQSLRARPDTILVPRPRTNRTWRQ
jgi:hypothetical protein